MSAPAEAESLFTPRNFIAFVIVSLIWGGTWLVIRDQIAADSRPDLSVLFNFVARSEQSTFEADARNGTYNAAAGFDLASALLRSALPRSGHLQVRAPQEGEPAWKQLLIHSGRGGGLKHMRESLKTVALELKTLVES